ncbi:MAG: polymer-forming cytoskeletal protein [Peptoniphilus sp.]|nr:polymer-forming cytoskeletal protein [Peptoniphilus sp.]MDY3118643.1 polymer-forming cytoskeletal protein [Peptoniphilus sp.]
MSKRRGSIALMAIFIFAIVSLLALVIFSRLEDNLLLLDTEKDEKQSSYYAESLAYLARREIKRAQLESVLSFGREFTLPKPEFENIRAEKVQLVPVREEGRYSAVKLETWCTYKGIHTVAQLYFQGVNPLFDQKDGVLSTEEMREEGVYDRWKIALEEQFVKTPPSNITQRTSDKAVTIRRKGTSYVQVSEEGIEKDFSPVMGTLRWEVAGLVKVEGPMEIRGVLWLKPGAHIEGDVHVEGVLIREAGSAVDGSLVVDGLLMGEKTGSIRANFQPRNVEKVFCFFDEFIKPNDYRLKKLY